MNIDEGLRALSFVQSVIPGALLAGGYLRDALTGHAPKDIDIFVPAGVHDWDALGGHLSVNAAQYMDQTEVAAVYDLSRTFEAADHDFFVDSGRFPVQVIELSPGFSPLERATRHDFGICQVWHDGKELGHTDAFARDVAQRTFTLTHCENGTEFDRSMRRYDRLSLKFPGYSLVIPPQFAQWMKT